MGLYMATRGKYVSIFIKFNRVISEYMRLIRGKFYHNCFYPNRVRRKLIWELGKIVDRLQLKSLDLTNANAVKKKLCLWLQKHFLLIFARFLGIVHTVRCSKKKSLTCKSHKLASLGRRWSTAKLGFLW